MNAALFHDLSAIGLGMVMRRNDGQFYACKTLRMPLSCSVKEAEALALREALLWALSLKLVDVEFETYSLLVVNSLSLHSLDCSEYGFLISDCVCLRGNGNYSIRFVKRQANKCAHVLARHACFNCSLYESFVIPSWLEEVFFLTYHLFNEGFKKKKKTLRKGVKYKFQNWMGAICNCEKPSGAKNIIYVFF